MYVKQVTSVAVIYSKVCMFRKKRGHIAIMFIIMIMFIIWIMFGKYLSIVSNFEKVIPPPSVLLCGQYCFLSKD